MTATRKDRGEWALAGWATLAVAFVGDAGLIGRGIAVASGGLAFGTFAWLARRALTPRLTLCATVAALVAPTLCWLAQSTVDAFVPLEAPILATCRNLSLAVLAGVFVRGRGRAWAIGLALATCVVAGLYVHERLCVPLYVGTMLVSCAAFGAMSGAPPAGRVAVYAAVVAACASTAWLIDDERHVGGRDGFVPSSGGTGAGSPRATMGVGDGPDVVDATRDGARTVGFDRSDVFVNSEHAGLYDAFIESFGEPTRSGEVKKMIGLKRDQIVTSARQAELDLRRGRTFSIRRAPPPAATRADADAAANALLWVDSDRSQHVPLRAYDRLEGDAWRPVAQVDVKASLHNVDEPHWMVRVDRPYGGAIGEAVATTITTGRFDDAVVPMPSLVTEFRLGRVDRTDFFRAAQPEFVRLRDRAVPAGTTVEVRHCLLRPDRFETSTPTFHAGRAPTLSDEPPAAVVALARRATSGVRAGWPQVRAVLDAVKSAGRFDNASTSAGDAPLDAFLSRGVGASYHFASVFALGLDALGYDARVVSGFYADARKRDPRSDQIVVGPTDAHVWCELRLADGTWIPIDPTPGFDVAVERPGRLALALAAARALAVGHAVGLAAASLAAVVAAMRWRRLASAMFTLAWRARLAVDRRDRFARTASLLDRRARLAGVPRPASQPFGRWLVERAPSTAIASFRDGLDRELYATSRVVDVAAALAAARELSFASLRRAGRAHPGVRRWP